MKYTTYVAGSPDPLAPGEEGEAGVRHLVDFHGWTEENATRGADLPADARKHWALKHESRHNDDHEDTRLDLPIVHCHDADEAFHSVVELAWWGETVKELLHTLIDVIDSDVKQGKADVARI